MFNFKKNMSEKDFDEFANKFAIEKNNLEIDKKLNLAQQLVRNNKINEAFEIIYQLKNEFEKGLTYKNNDEYALYSFNDAVEFVVKIIFDKKQGKTPTIHWIMAENRSYCNIYTTLAYILIEQGKLDEAQEALLEAQRWNPMSANILLELSEIELKKGNLDNATRLIQESFVYATNPTVLAKCYRKLGYCYTEKRQFNIASALYIHSLQFEENDIAFRELAYINEQAGNKFEIKCNTNDILKQYNLPIQASNLILAAIFKMLHGAEERNDRQNFISTLTLFKSLIVDTNMLESLENIQIPSGN